MITSTQITTLKIWHTQLFYNHGHNILRIFDVCQFFLSPQVKKCQNGSKKLVYTSCLASPKRLKTLDVRKLGKFRIMSKLYGIISECPVFLPKREFVNTTKNLLENRNFTFP